MGAEIKHILCSVDFSQFTDAVLQSGVALAKKHQTSFTVFHAVYQPRDPLYNDRGMVPEPSLRRQANQAEKRIVALMDDHPVPYQAIVSIGEPVEALKHVTETTQTDLVVAASYGLSGFKRLFLGTVVERMARMLTCPMLIIRPTKTDSVKLEKYRKILVACDLTTAPDPLIPKALLMAQSRNTDYYLFHANASPLDMDVVDPTNAPYQQIQEAVQTSRAQKLLAGIPAGAYDLYSFKTAMRPGPPVDALAEFLAENPVDLIVVGVKKGRLKRMFIGSTTEYAMRRAPCAVLTVPLPTQARQKGLPVLAPDP